MNNSAADRDPIELLADSFLARYRRGERPSVEDYARQHPELAEEIRELLAALVMLEQEKPPAGAVAATEGGSASAASGSAPRQLGDYVILREIGRGGMGVVYESVQQSLGRHVALKVLPLQGLGGSSQLARFRMEARAAARLHHTNIVPVFGVGECEGVHYYAMQFIQGQGLDVVIDALRRFRSGAAPVVEDRGDTPVAAVCDVRPPTAVLTEALLTGRFVAPQPEPGPAVATSEPDGAQTSPPAQDRAQHRACDSPRSEAGRSSALASSQAGAAYHRSVAGVGLQVAEALAHAHGQEILHRDIKPSNLLLDALGIVWVTDFGLAKAGGGDGPTRTGDIVGTLRYMAPERFKGWSDQRSDIYALGATLYELLTLRPPFRESDQVKLIEQVLNENPVPPRKLDRRIPRDLETIVLKAMAKWSGNRYTTAERMAEDLRRFLADRPVLARRTTTAEHAWRWCLRNPLAASLVASLAVVLVGGFVGMSVLWLRAERHADHARDQQAKAERLASLEASARAEAQKQTRLAQQQSRSAHERAEQLRRSDYISRVNLAYRECLEDNVGRALELLEGCPKDLQGWEWKYVRHQCHLDLRTLRGHSESVNAVSFNSDGTRIVSGGGRPYLHPVAQDRAELILWDATNGREIVRFPGLNGSVHSVAFSPDGARIASGSGSYGMPAAVEGRVTLWDARTRKILWDKTERLLNPLSVAFSRDGRRLGAGFGIWSSEQAKGRLRVWDAQTGGDVLSADAPPGGVNQIAFSPDRKTLAAACSGVVELWGVEPPAKLRELKGHTSGIFGVAYDPDGKRLATAGWDETVKLWDPGTGALLLTIDEHKGNVNGVAFSPDGRSLASAGDDHTVRLWDAASGRELRRFRGHHAAVLGVAYSPEGRSLASASEDGTVRIWDAALDHNSALSGHTGLVTGVAFSPDGRRAATASGDGTVAVWETTTGTRLHRLAGGKGWVNSVAYSPDGTLIAAAGEHAAAQIWDAVQRRVLREFVNLDGFVRVVAFSPDGRLLAAGTGVHDFAPNIPGSVYVWDVATGAEVRRFRGHAGRVLSLAFSADGRLIASGGGSPEDRPHPSHEVILWEATTGNVIHRLLGHSRRINGLAISRDGQWLASACADGVVSIWDVTTGSLIRSSRGPSKGLISLAFHPEGNRLAVGALDRTITLWDPALGDLIISLTGHTAGVSGLEFSRDGTRLVSGSFDRTARIWDASPPGDAD
jgi:WD40 repeat protein/serine/threonine protein kinase